MKASVSNEDYWNGVAEANSKDGVMRDNWSKRRGLVRHLLAYDITKTDVLEIGCGLGLTAGMLQMIYGGYFKYTGTDQSKRFCSLAHNYLNLHTVQTKADSMPFGDNSFNVLFAFDVLEHIPSKDKSGVYQELNRLLRDESFIFVNDPHPSNKCGHIDAVEHGFDLSEMIDLMNLEILEYSVYKGYDDFKYRFIALKRRGYDC